VERRKQVTSFLLERFLRDHPRTGAQLLHPQGVVVRSRAPRT
jgi:hypothetical protein